MSVHLLSQSCNKKTFHASTESRSDRYFEDWKEEMITKSPTFHYWIPSLILSFLDSLLSDHIMRQTLSCIYNHFRPLNRGSSLLVDKNMRDGYQRTWKICQTLSGRSLMNIVDRWYPKRRESSLPFQLSRLMSRTTPW